MLPSTRRVSPANASGSKPKSNTKNDRISQPLSKSMKNKVEAHHRKFKSSDNKKKHVLDCNAIVKNVALSKNSDTFCLSCNECLFSANHDACVVQYLKKMQKHKVAKSANKTIKVSENQQEGSLKQWVLNGFPLALTTSHKKNNKPYVDASRMKQTTKIITKEHAVKQNTRKADNTMLPSTRRVSPANASGSKPKSNTKNDRISQPLSKSMKNKVEAHHRKFKSSDNKKKHVLDCNAIVKNVALSKNSDTFCLSCNECLFSANHDACVVQYLKKMQKHKVAKSANKTIKVSENQQEGSLKQWVLNGFPLNGLIRQRSFCNNNGIWISTNKEYSYLHVYYVVGLGHNLFSVGKFCDSDLEVAFRKHTCFVRNLEGVDILSGSRGSNLYIISMVDMMKSSPICPLSKASKKKSWFWHRRLSHLNFSTNNKLAKQGLVKGLPKLKYTKDHMCSACRMGKRKKESHPHKPEPSTNEKLEMLHIDLCGLITKDEVLEIIIKFLKKAQVSLNATTTSTSVKPLIKNDWELLFQPMFDEYFKNVSAASNPIYIATLPLPDTAAASSSSTSIDKDVPSL
nr:integrase, catalytic region, zinc finger, CCHC-type, peptidase aspartic, catalytic [Tanacetum cinerariifolium]